MANFIQEYLDARLFNIADSEERLTKLQASAESLCETFLANNGFLLTFLRASLVPKVDEDSDALAQIETHIKNDWPTFRSAQPYRPTAILLAVGWQAALKAVEKNPELCALIWYGSANLLAEPNVDLRAKPAIDFVQAQGAEMELRAIAQWTPHASKITKNVKSVTLGEVKNVLQPQLLKATSATDPSTSTAIDGGNNHQPSIDGNWALFFSKSASAAITNAMAQNATAIADAVQIAFEDLNEKVTLVSNELTRSHTAQSKRTELLWLSESLYSIRLKKGYRELTPNETIVALAADIAEIALGLSPQSVEFFLAENVQRLLPSSEIKLDNFVRDMVQSPIRNKYPAAIFEPIGGTLRIGLLELIGAISAAQCDIKQFTAKTGFAKSKGMSPSDLAKWIFREIKCTECLHRELWS